MAESRDLIRILLVEDDPDDQWLVADLFKQLDGGKRHQLTVVSTYTAGLEALAGHCHDLGLIDIRLGAESGLDLLLATADDAQRPPLIILTGQADPDVDRRALSAGAADFLVKSGLTAERLDRSLRYTLAQRRLLRELEDSQTRYRTMFNTSPVPMWLYEPDGFRIVEVNDAALAQYGYTREEFLGLTALDLREPAEIPRFLAYSSGELGSSNDPRAGTWKHRRKDGSTLYVEIVRGHLLVSGRSLRLAASTDVTARLQAEAVLLERELTLRHVLRDVSDGLIVVDDTDCVQFVNPALCRMLGRPERELVGEPINPQLIGTDDLHVSMVNAFGSPLALDLRVAETTWNGRNARVVTLRDVTEAQSRESRLLLLQRAIESATEGITIAVRRGSDHTLIYANPAFEKMTGYRADELLGRDCRFLQSDDVEQKQRETLRTALSESSHCVVTLRNYRKDGSLFWNRLTISPVLDANGHASHYIGIQSDVTEQKMLENERRFLATHDRVTGLPRYDGSEARLEALLSRARSANVRMALFFVDLDGFNSVNSTLGFAMGDAALKKTGERLRELAGPGAEVLRYAGDEFLVAFLDEGNPEDLLGRATDLCERIAQPMPIAPSVTVFLTASVGASLFPDNGNSVLELTRQADIATNRAKQNGRNGAFVFSNDMREALADRMALGGRMRDALANEEFLLHYQPQVSAQDGSVIGLEALVRWNSPVLGLLPPARFIPVAENNGMILHLGAWVLRSACRQLRAWMDAGLSGFAVSVNVSGAQMQRPSFVDDVQEVIETSGIDPSMLELELTETVLMENAERSMAQMRALKKLGLRLALDDFGVGYSSLSYLKRFQLDKLKIDKSFIADIVHDGADAALVRAMIAMGHHLGMRVVAEGVETAAQLGYLRRSHCDEFQGYHFSRPLPAAHIPDLMARRYILPASSGPSESQRTLLVLDDEANIRRALVRLLRRDGYQIFDVGTASEAFDVLASHDVQVVLSDQRMPGLSGSEFLSQVKEMYPDTVRMVLSGYTDLNAVTDAINRGAIYKFLTKPWDDDDLRAHVLEAFRRHDSQRQGD
jgi:diguanylate cyclase (GGDEF)-like protein/PAS domain S-box-containing protein